MNQHKSPNSQLLQFMLRAQQLARQDIKTDKGYAMMMTSIITIMLFSLMGAFFTMTNLAKSSTDAYIDGNNTFYAAEAGMNRRAQELRSRFENYNSPSDGATTVAEKNQVDRKPSSMSSCYGSTTAPTPTSDFECRNYTFTYNNNIARTAGNSADTTVLSEADGNSSKVEYKAYTFVADKTNYDTSSVPAPIPTVIAAGTYAGLNAQEYKYTVNATAAKPSANTGSQVEQSGDNKTVLQMDFKSRTIPLFQFGAFYERDLELNPSPLMTFNGRLHSNQNVYLTAGNGNTLTLNGIITAVTSINAGNPTLPNGYQASGTVQIQKDEANATSLVSLSATSTPNPNPTTTAVPVISKTSTQTEVDTVTATYNGKLRAKNVTTLTPPPVSFLTKVDASKTNSVGEYYGKADLRLEMFPDRAVPFTLQVIKGGTTANTSCTTNGFSISNVSVERSGYNTANCSNLSEGQLRSLMQPVLVRPKSTIEYTTFCTKPVGEVRTSPQVGTAVNITIKDSTATPDLAVKERILDALALTLAAQTAPVTYSALSTPLSTTAQTQFGGLLANIPGLAPGDLNTLVSAAPRNIAALNSTTTKDNTTTGSCFRPAPIQALFTPGDFSTAAALTANTPTNFNDRRENRYIRMLQTNMESLTLWNRDGLFTTGVFDGDLTTADDNSTAPQLTALSANLAVDNTTKSWTNKTNSSGDNLLFTKADPVTTALVYNPTTKSYEDSTLATNLFRTMGLAASDRTEGGLVLYATINKTTYPYLTVSTTQAGDTRQSPYGFAFNDGANLPAPLTIATDQPVYSQGDWNTLDQQPASFLADTIAILSNSCLATTDTGTMSPWASTNVGTTVVTSRATTLGIVLGTATGTTTLPPSLSGQLNCGSIAGIPTMATPTTVNAAFLSKTDASITAPEYYSGGLNNYMRILETWTNQEMKYKGSFVSLGAPLEVSGRYRACGTPLTNNYGCPPNRNWAYDTSFNSYTGLPPLPPKVIELQQDSFRRKFN
jgi:hypothetical protein